MSHEISGFCPSLPYYVMHFPKVFAYLITNLRPPSTKSVASFMDLKLISGKIGILIKIKNVTSPTDKSIKKVSKITKIS